MGGTNRCGNCNGRGRGSLIDFIAKLPAQANNFIVGLDDDKEWKSLRVCTANEVDSFLAKSIPDSPWPPGKLVLCRDEVCLEFAMGSTTHSISVYRVGENQYVMHSHAGGWARGYPSDPVDERESKSQETHLRKPPAVAAPAAPPQLPQEPEAQSQGNPAPVSELCVLCGRTRMQVKKLILGVHGGVCPDCVALCNELLAQEASP